jgi:hypothetical protein
MRKEEKQQHYTLGVMQTAIAGRGDAEETDRGMQQKQVHSPPAVQH